tara:strand:- start:356 stop:553 length:198 start_codon:yes stop_codon:yes gene_type:complete
MENFIEFLLSPFVFGSIAFCVLLRVFAGGLYWQKDTEKRRQQEHGALMAVLMVIMFSLFVIIDKL